jgi:hypothetical protein
MLLSTHLLYLFVGIFALFAAVMWFVFLRPVERRTARGVITHKIFKAAGQYVQYPVGMRDSFYSPSTIPIAESYVFMIHVEGLSREVGYSLNSIAGREYEVGQKVNLEYQERSIPLVWKRVYATQMSCLS